MLGKAVYLMYGYGNKFCRQIKNQTLKLVQRVSSCGSNIGLKKTPIFHLFTCQVVTRQLVIGQFNKPITLKVVVLFKSTNLIQGCSLNQPITTIKTTTPPLLVF